MQRAPRASFQQMHDQGAKKSTGAEDHGPDQEGIPAVRNKQLGRRSPAGLILEMDIGTLVAVVVAHDKAGMRLWRSIPWFMSFSGFNMLY